MGAIQWGQRKNIKSKEENVEKNTIPEKIYYLDMIF
jgi:hypothetical protein